MGAKGSGVNVATLILLLSSRLLMAEKHQCSVPAACSERYGYFVLGSGSHSR